MESTRESTSNYRLKKTNIKLYIKLHKIIDKEDLPKYYDMYWKNFELFEIVRGYKHIISLLSEYYKKKLSHKRIVEKMYERMKEKSTKKSKRNHILQQLS